MQPEQYSAMDRIVKYCSACVNDTKLIRNYLLDRVHLLYEMPPERQSSMCCMISGMIFILFSLATIMIYPLLFISWLMALVAMPSPFSKPASALLVLLKWFVPLTAVPTKKLTSMIENPILSFPRCETQKAKYIALQRGRASSNTLLARDETVWKLQWRILCIVSSALKISMVVFHRFQSESEWD